MPHDQDSDDEWLAIDMSARNNAIVANDVDGLSDRMMTVSMQDDSAPAAASVVSAAAAATAATAVSAAAAAAASQTLAHGGTYASAYSNGIPEQAATAGGSDQEMATLSHHDDMDANVTTNERGRTFREVRDSGPAAPPVPFDPPQFVEAARAREVLVYDESRGEHFVAHNVLYRTEGETGGGGGAISRRAANRAYWPLPNKSTIDTRMGHLEISVVLKLCPKSDDTDDDDDDDNDDDVDDDDEDIVFLLTDQYVAVKVNYCDRMERLLHLNAENPLNEIAAQRLVGNDNPHVLGAIEVLYDGECLNVVMPYCGGGDLFDAVDYYLKNNESKHGLPESQARFWFRQLLKGMDHLQACGICHRDLSPENVIITDDRCLVIDLGMSLRVPFTSRDGAHMPVTDVSRGTTRRLMTPQGQCGKRRYMSPEIWRNRDNFDGFAIDIWTAGTILFFMLTGQTYIEPFDNIFRCVVSDLPNLLRFWNMELSRSAIDLLQGILVVDPRDRLSLGQIMAHPWVTNNGRDT